MKKTNSLLLHIQKGVTMLEMMMVLAIMGMLLVLATRYYQTTHAASQVATALESIQAIYSAEQQYCNDNDCTAKITTPTLQRFIDNGLLPSNIADYGNPWGTIADATHTGFTYAATFSNVSQPDCINLKQKVTAAYDTVDKSGAVTGGEIQIPTDCTKADGNVEIDFQ